MRKTNEGASPVRPVLFGAAAGLLATLVLMLVCAVLVHQGTLGAGTDPRRYRSPVWWPDACSPRFSRRGVCPTAGSPSQSQAARWIFLILLAVCALALSQPVRFGRTAVSLLCAVALFGEWNQRIPSGSVKPKRFFRFTVGSNADHD